MEHICVESGLPVHEQVRCKRCNILFATRDGMDLNIERGGFEVNVDGARRVTFRCYRSRCRALNVLTLRSDV